MIDIFVFGSNLLGIHGKGAALHALTKCGALMGQSMGLQGHSYAIPTKSSPYITLPLYQINKFVADFICFAADKEQLIFKVTPIGCGLAGYSPKDIAPMFLTAQDLTNIVLPDEFKDFLK